MAPTWLIVLACAAVANASAATIAGDARRGADLLRSEGCVKCHTVNGRGGGTAPDLGIRTSRDFTPSSMAGLMWNHAPAMWAAMAAQGVPRPQLSEQNVADLFAYLYAAQYFDRPGDAARGSAVFRARRCVECHTSGPGKPIAQWESVTDPLELVGRMWNHAALMRDVMAQKGIAWAALDAQELRDLVVYVRNLPGAEKRVAEFALAEPGNGAALFQDRGCAGCHQGKLALDKRLSRHTLTDIAAAMWNHAPRMMRASGGGLPQVTSDEMRQIVSHLWGTQFFAGGGNPSRGKRVFSTKRCATCHDQAGSGAPQLAGRSHSAITIVTALWRHGPAMLEQMKQKGLAWPQFHGADVADIVAFLNSRSR